MKIITSPRIQHYVARVSVFLIAVALIAGMAGCDGNGGTPSQNLEIYDWYDLDAVRDNLAGNHKLMNNLNSTTPGYIELASPTANQGQGWEPIGTQTNSFEGSFDGQGYEIRGLFINRPGETGVGLFGVVGQDGVIKDIGVMNVTVTGITGVGGLMGGNIGTVSNSYSTGNVTGGSMVGGLMGGNMDMGTVSNSYSTCSVTGHSPVGGLVGWNEGTVINSYSASNVSGVANVGGLVGLNDGGTVSNSYSAGNVTGNLYVGGLVGASFGNVNNSFWDLQTSGQNISAGGTGKNTTEMQDIATFSGAAWDIIAVALNETNPAYIWNIVNNVTYPFLSWET